MQSQQLRHLPKISGSEARTMVAKLAHSPMAEIIARLGVKSAGTATSAHLNGAKASGWPLTKPVKERRINAHPHLGYHLWPHRPRNTRKRRSSMRKLKARSGTSRFSIHSLSSFMCSVRVYHFADGQDGVVVWRAVKSRIEWRVLGSKPTGFSVV